MGAAGGWGHCVIENEELLRIVPEDTLVRNGYLVNDICPF